MKTKNRIIIVFSLLIAMNSTFIKAQSPYIYGMVFTGTDNSFLGRLNYQTGKFDSIMFLGNILSVKSSAACSDPSNNRYFFCGEWAGHSGNYHIINLNDFTVESFSSRDGVKIEYNPYNNSLIFQEVNDFCAINLGTKIINCFSSPLVNSGTADKVRVFNPIDTSYVYINNRQGALNTIYSLLAIDANNGNVRCIKDSLKTYLGDDFVIDNTTGNLFCHQNEKVFRIEPCTGKTTQLLTITGYSAHLNQQMAVYDQVRKKYIIPFVTIGYKAKIAVIDMLTYKIDTIYLQPNDGMNFQQIGSYPVSIQELKHTFISRIYPNPMENQAELSIENFNSKDGLQYNLFDFSGKMIYSEKILSNQTIIKRNNLLNGLYFISIVDKNGMIKGTEKIILQ